MKINSRYGKTDAVKRCDIHSPSQCPFCKRGEKMKKGEPAFVLTLNAGPTGRVFLCPTHAKQLAFELKEITFPDHLK